MGHLEKERDGLRLVGSRDGLVVTNCYEKLVRYCTKYAYPDYDVVGAQFSSESSIIQPELLNAMNRAMRARSPRKVWKQFIGVELPELAAISMDVDLVESSDEDYANARKSLRVLYERLAAVAGITDMAATKMTYLKRPRLVAISDSYIREALDVDEPRWKDFGSRGAFYAERALRVADAVRKVGAANSDLLADLQARLCTASYQVSKARIIDILLWMDMAISRNGLAIAEGWTTIANEIRGH